MDTSSDDAHDAIHDPRFEAERLDHLVLLALGEAVPATFESHSPGCAECQRDLAAIGRTVALGREAVANGEHLTAAPPPESVWAGIAGELREDADRSRPRHVWPRPTDRGSRLSARLRYGLAAAAVVLAVLGAGVGYLAGRAANSGPNQLASNAHLAAVPGGPVRATGSAAVHVSADGRRLTVTTTGLPLRNGFYEVWLFDPDHGASGDMVAIGALGDHGRGTFTLPAGIELGGYHVVNISAQNYGGGSSIVHAQSVLQGSLGH